MIDALLNTVRREAGRVMSRLALPKCGTVTAYDPSTYSAKVLLHPEEVETGWLPVRTPWSGNGWGMFCPPTPGDEVEVNFQEGGKQAPYVALRAFGDRFRPLPVPSGEFWLVDKLGNSFKFSGGKVLINGATEIDVTSPVVQITAATSVSVFSPQISMGGSGDALHQLVTDALVALFNNHTHTNVQAGSGTSGPPAQLMGAPHLTTVLRAD